MTSPADFADLFADCHSFRDSNVAYRKGVEILQEAHRLCMSRLVKDRDGAGTPAAAKRTAPEASETALAVKHSHDAIVRRWATSQGIPFQRVSKKLREMYDEATSVTISPESDANGHNDG